MTKEEYQKLKEYYKEYHRKYYLKHKKEIQIAHKNYYRKHKKDYTRRTKESRHKLRIEIIEFLGGKCTNPFGQHSEPYIDIRCLQIDHIRGNGHKEKKIIGVDTPKFYQRIRNHPKDYQLLCANCNWIKRWENKEFNDGKLNKEGE